MKIDPSKLGTTNTGAVKRGDSFVASLMAVAVPDGGVVRVRLEELHPFRGHPYRVLDDEDMDELVESIRTKGVIEPGLVRRDPAGGFELLSGHRRHRASLLAGIPDMPVMVLDASDADATIIMVDSNCRRSKILPSEAARAAKMKQDALKSQGRRTDLLPAQASGSYNKTLYRMAHLTELVPGLMTMVDNGSIPLSAGYALSYIPQDKQSVTLELMDMRGIKTICNNRAEELKSCKDEPMPVFINSVRRIFQIAEQPGTPKVRNVGIKIPDTYLSREAMKTLRDYAQDEELLQRIAAVVAEFAKEHGKVRLIG